MRGEIVLIIVIVLVVGFWVGRLYAEIRRAQRTMMTNWYQRQDYRKKPPPEKPDWLRW
ncbi:MAG: hypothetical protein ACRDRP_07905 [Pseudonocardiaceae bacterium]